MLLLKEQLIPRDIFSSPLNRLRSICMPMDNLINQLPMVSNICQVLVRVMILNY